MMLLVAIVLTMSVQSFGSGPPSAVVTSGMKLVYDWDRDHCPKFPQMPPPQSAYRIFLWVAMVIMSTRCPECGQTPCKGVIECWGTLQRIRAHRARRWGLR